MPRGRFYILEGREPKGPVSLMMWAAWFETHGQERIVARTKVPGGDVSTVFIGAGRVLFETKVFGGPADGDGARYDTWKAAVAGHRAMVSKLRGYPEDE